MNIDYTIHYCQKRQYFLQIHLTGCTYVSLILCLTDSNSQMSTTPSAFVSYELKSSNVSVGNSPSKTGNTAL